MFNLLSLLNFCSRSLETCEKIWSIVVCLISHLVLLGFIYLLTFLHVSIYPDKVSIFIILMYLHTQRERWYFLDCTIAVISCHGFKCPSSCLHGWLNWRIKGIIYGCRMCLMAHTYIWRSKSRMLSCTGLPWGGWASSAAFGAAVWR